jgi:error-prone DNA polymerase
LIQLEPRFAELAATTNFSFLRGASHPEEMVARAAELGLAGIGIADRNSLAGIVRAHIFARDNVEAMAVTRVVPGARLVFIDGRLEVLAYPRDRAAYGRLCRILTEGNRRAPKGECWLILKDLVDHGDGLQIVALPPSPKGAGKNAAPSQEDKEKLACKELDEDVAIARLREAFGERLWIGASLTYGVGMRNGACALRWRSADRDQRRADACSRTACARRRPCLHTRENHA